MSDRNTTEKIKCQLLATTDRCVVDREGRFKLGEGTQNHFLGLREEPGLVKLGKVSVYSIRGFVNVFEENRAIGIWSGEPPGPTK